MSSYKVQPPYPLELDNMKWEVALSKIQFPNNFFTIRDGHNVIIKQYLFPSRDDLNYLYNNVEGEGNKEERKKTRNTAWKQDYVYQESKSFCLVLMIVLNRLPQLQSEEGKNIRSIDYSYHQKSSHKFGRKLQAGF